MSKWIVKLFGLFIVVAVPGAVMLTAGGCPWMLCEDPAGDDQRSFYDGMAAVSEIYQADLSGGACVAEGTEDDGEQGGRRDTTFSGRVRLRLRGQDPQPVGPPPPAADGRDDPGPVPPPETVGDE